VIAVDNGCVARVLFVDVIARHRADRHRVSLIQELARAGPFTQTNAMTTFALTTIKLSRSWRIGYGAARHSLE
jgi:hypothetical protein